MYVWRSSHSPVRLAMFILVDSSAYAYTDAILFCHSYCELSFAPFLLPLFFISFRFLELLTLHILIPYFRLDSDSD